MRPQADADADGQCLSRHLSASAPLRHLRTFLRTLRTFEMSARFSSHSAAPTLLAAARERLIRNGR